MKNSKGWWTIGIINLVVLLVIMGGLLWFTEHFIDKKRRVTVLYQSDPLNRWRMVPNQELQIQNARISINSLGFRGPVPAPEKDNSICRVMVMGGSSVFDTQVDEKGTWPRLLERELRKGGRPTLETFNMGVPGYSSRETLALYHDRIRYFHPDLVLLYQGWNDVKYMKLFLTGVETQRYFVVKDWRKPYRFLTEPFPWRNIHALGVIWDEVVDKVQGLRENAADPEELMAASSPKEFLQGISSPSDLKKAWAETPGMSYWKKNVEAFILEVRSDGVLPVLIAQATLTAPGLQEEMKRKIAYHWIYVDHSNLLAINEAMVEVLGDLAQKYKIPFIDVRKKMNGRADYFNDHVHLKPEGSSVLARELAVEISSRLENSPLACLSRPF